MMRNPMMQYQPAPFVGPQAAWSPLIDNLSAAPFEGCWVPTLFLKTGSISVTGSATSLSAGVYGSNALGEPLNTYTVTIGGTITAADVVSLAFTNPNFAAGSETVSHTVGALDSATTIAAALVTAINADTVLSPASIRATSAGAVITITFPSAYLASGSPSNTSYNINSSTGQGAPPINSTALGGSVTGAATETVSIAAGTDGNEISAITGNGFYNMANLPRYLKLRIATVSGGTVTAHFQGVA